MRQMYEKNKLTVLWCIIFFMTRSAFGMLSDKEKQYETNIGSVRVFVHEQSIVAHCSTRDAYKIGIVSTSSVSKCVKTGNYKTSGSTSYRNKENKIITFQWEPDQNELAVLKNMIETFEQEQERCVK